MQIERLPEPLKSLLRRVILQVRIPLNQLRTLYNKWLRRWYRWRTSDPTRWVEIDFAERAGKDVGIFCISLMEEARFEPRRRLFQKYARKYGWPVEFWPGVNGAGISSEDLPAWLAQEKRACGASPLAGGEVGLLISVKQLYQWAWDRQLEFLVVFEDDAVIHWTPVLELPETFDIVFMNNRFYGDIWGRVMKGWGNDGYVISRRGIEKMLEILDYANEAIDLLMMRYTKSLAERTHYVTRHRDQAKPQLECYHVGPIVTHAGYFPSSIGLISNEARQKSPDPSHTKQCLDPPQG